MTRRRKSWSPPAASAHLRLPEVPSLGASGAPATGTSWPATGHVATTKPACTVCSKPAMQWARCACGTTFALCSEHGLPGDAGKQRAAHQVKVGCARTP